MAFDGDDMPWGSPPPTRESEIDVAWADTSVQPHPSQKPFVSRREKFEAQFHPLSGDPSSNRTMQAIRFTIDRTLLVEPKATASSDGLEELKSKIIQERLSHRDEMEDPVEDEYDELLNDMTTVIEDSCNLIDQVTELQEYVVTLEGHGFDLEEEREYLLNNLDEVEHEAQKAAAAHEEELATSAKAKLALEAEIERLTAELERFKEEQEAQAAEARNDNDPDTENVRRPNRQLPNWLRPRLPLRRQNLNDDGNSHSQADGDVDEDKDKNNNPADDSHGPSNVVNGKPGEAEEGKRFLIPFRRRRRGLNRQNSQERQDANPQSQPPSPNASNNKIMQ